MAIDPTTTSSYLHYLPAIFSVDPFLGRFLLAFEQVLTRLQGGEADVQRGLEEIIADIAKLFDPNETPEEFLQWLAGWGALSPAAAISRQSRPALPPPRHQKESGRIAEDLHRVGAGDH